MLKYSVIRGLNTQHYSISRNLNIYFFYHCACIGYVLQVLRVLSIFTYSKQQMCHMQLVNFSCIAFTVSMYGHTESGGGVHVGRAIVCGG